MGRMRTRSPVGNSSVRSNRARLRVSIWLWMRHRRRASRRRGRLHDRRHPAVEVDRGARDERRARGDEERDEVAELLRLAHAADRHALGALAIDGLDAAALRAALPLLALHEPEAD